MYLRPKKLSGDRVARYNFLIRSSDELRFERPKVSQANVSFEEELRPFHTKYTRIKLFAESFPTEIQVSLYDKRKKR